MLLLPNAIIWAVFFLCCHFLIAYFYCRKGLWSSCQQSDGNWTACVHFKIFL